VVCRRRISVVQSKLADPATRERLARFVRTSLARFVRTSVEGWKSAVAPMHEAEAARLMLRNGAAEGLQ